jgi:hypothetical protein
MRASARDVAMAMFRSMPIDPERINGDTTKALAICVSQGNGALRIGSSTKIVLTLCDVLACGDNLCPHLVQANLTTELRPGAICTTERVAHHYREEVRGDIGRRTDGFYPDGYQVTWLPVPLDTTGYIAFRGPDVQPKANTVGLRTVGLEIDWFDLWPLTDYPIGCIIWRLQPNGVLVAYQRVLRDKWVVIIIQQPERAVDLVKVISQLGVTSIQPVQGTRPLLYKI